MPEEKDQPKDEKPTPPKEPTQPTEPKPAEKAEEEEGDQEPTKDPIKEAKQAVKDMAEQNRIMAENIKEAKKVTAEQLLGGHSSAGGEGRSEEQKKNDSAKALIAGTGLEDDIFPEE